MQDEIKLASVRRQVVFSLDIGASISSHFFCKPRVPNQRLRMSHEAGEFTRVEAEAMLFDNIIRIYAERNYRNIARPCLDESIREPFNLACVDDETAAPEPLVHLRK